MSSDGAAAGFLTKERRVTAADWVSSWIGFTSALVVSHPFSTMAVRWQTLHRRPIDSLRVDGIRSLYGGFFAPVIFAGPFVASTFASNEAYKRWLRSKRPGVDEPLRKRDLMLAGALSGVTMSVIACPMAFVRVQQQNSGAGGNKTLSVVSIVNSTMSRSGVRGFYAAWHVDVVASSTAWMVYFSAYEIAKRELATLRGGSGAGDGAPAPLLDSVLASAITSIVTWSLCMPTDLLRNRMQADAGREVSKRLYQGAVDCIRKTYAADGVKGFWRGVGMVMMRSMASSCVSLPTFDRLKPRMRTLFGADDPSGKAAV